MNRKTFLIVAGIAMSFLAGHQVYSQSANKSVVIKKGEVLDILLLSQNPDTQEDLKSYFQTAFPVAKRMSYQPMPGFKIKAHSQGNIRPAILTFGKWSDIKNREDFLTEITKEVPDFHERRRTIWSYFGLAYYEMPEDVSFEIDHAKFNVATAYWLTSKDKLSKFYQSWARNVDKMEGKILINLKEGTSPFGYLYAPDYFVISSWENEVAFKAFQDKTQKMDRDNIQQVNEFILE